MAKIKPTHPHSTTNWNSQKIMSFRNGDKLSSLCSRGRDEAVPVFFFFFYYNKFLVEKKGLGDYGAVTLVSKTERGQKFSITQECRGGGTLSKTEAVMLCQGNWVSQQPARMKSSVHGRR